MEKLTIVLFAVAAICLHCEAKRFTERCDLVHELRRQGFPEDKMRDWVCLIENTSDRKTHALGKPDAHGFRSYGLFWISDPYWCSNTGVPGKTCNITCADMLTDDITLAAACAKVVYERRNFLAWNGWISHCLGEPLPNISNC